MRAIPSALLAHLQGTVTTVATCWRIERRDEVVMGFTDHVTDLPVDGVIYTARTGYTRSAIDGNSTLAVDNLEIEGYVDSADITAEDLRAGKYDGATLDVFLVNYESISDGKAYLRTGIIGEVALKDEMYLSEVRGLAQRFTQVFPEMYSKTCRAHLGDARCKVAAGNFTVGGTVLAITEARKTFTATIGGAAASGWFTGGVVTWTSGSNIGLSMEVKRYTNASGGLSFTLFLPMPHVIAADDEFTVVAGCDKTFATCKSKFSNGANFRGEPHVPHNDVVMRYPDGH